jgi:acetolactate synthase I/II/III large subunit
VNGAEIFVKTAVDAGIEVCFANAGTTEIPILTAFDSVPGIRTFLGLFEGVCTGAADGYGRMLDKPAMALLHHGPGLANGIANLHNARRAGTPLLNIVGDHTSWHRPADPPLTMDIEALAQTVSRWVRTSKSAESLSRDTADALTAAGYGEIASLVIPHDHQLAELNKIKIEVPRHFRDALDTGSIEKISRALKSSNRSALFLGGRALRREGLEIACRIKAAIGCALFAPSFPGYMERGAGLPVVDRIPYFPEDAKALLSGYDVVVLAGAKEPVTFFGYEGTDSMILGRDQKKHYVGTGRESVVEALASLAEALGSPLQPDVTNIVAKPWRPEMPYGRLTAEKACVVLAALQPESAVIIDEGITSAMAYNSLTAGVPPHSVMGVTGGAIGYGMPCATGAAIACPGRPVINIQADGSALYTVQALWTQAREALNVTTLICSNRSYNILKLELSRAGRTMLGPRTSSLIDFDNPAIGWTKIASGFGVPGVMVNTAEGLANELSKALAEPGPHLIEMVF